MAETMIPRGETRANPTRRTILKGLGAFTAGAGLTSATVAAAMVEDTGAVAANAVRPAADLMGDDGDLVTWWGKFRAANRDLTELGTAYRLRQADTADASELEAAWDEADDREAAAYEGLLSRPAQGPVGVLVKLRYLQFAASTSQISPDDPFLVDAIAALERLTGYALPMCVDPRGEVPSRCPPLPASGKAMVDDELRAIMRDVKTEPEAPPEPPAELVRLWQECRIEARAAG